MKDLSGAVGKHWGLSEIVLEGSPIEDVVRARAEIILERDQRAHGYGGCNRFTGKYLLKDGEIKFEAMASTKMYCMDTMEIEDAFFKALYQVGLIDLGMERMIMRSKDGSTQLVFHPTKPKF